MARLVPNDRNAVVGVPTWRPLSSYSTNGTAATDYPVSQLEDDRITKKWRSDSLSESDLQIEQTWDRIRPCGGGAVVNHNLRTTDSLRLELFKETGPLANRVYDSGFVPAWLLGYPFDSVQPEHYAFMTGRFTARELANRVPMRPLWFAATEYNAKGARWTFKADSHPDGYVEAGLLDVFQGTQLVVNMAYGSSLRFLDNTIRTEMPNGGELRRAGFGQRAWNLSVEYAPHEHALALWGQIWMSLRERPFTFIPRPDDPANYQREAFLAIDASDEGGLEIFAPNPVDRTQVRLEEVLI